MTPDEQNARLLYTGGLAYGALLRIRDLLAAGKLTTARAATNEAILTITAILAGREDPPPTTSVPTADNARSPAGP